MNNEKFSPGDLLIPEFTTLGLPAGSVGLTVASVRINKTKSLGSSFSKFVIPISIPSGNKRIETRYELSVFNDFPVIFLYKKKTKEKINNNKDSFLCDRSLVITPGLICGWIETQYLKKPSVRLGL